MAYSLNFSLSQQEEDEEEDEDEDEEDNGCFISSSRCSCSHLSSQGNYTSGALGATMQNTDQANLSKKFP